MSELAEFRGGPLDGQLRIVRDLSDFRVPVMRDAAASFVAADIYPTERVAFDVVIYRCAGWAPRRSERGVYVFSVSI